MARFRLDHLNGVFQEGDFYGQLPEKNAIIDASVLGGQGYARYVGTVAAYDDGELLNIAHFVEERQS